MNALSLFLMILAPVADTTPGTAPGSKAVPSAGIVIGENADAPKAVTEADYADELVKILDTTKSPHTYVLTLMLLVKAKGNRARVVPAALRNADRLGIFPPKKSSDGEVGPDAEEIAELTRDTILALGGAELKAEPSASSRASRQSKTGGYSYSADVASTPNIAQAGGR